MKNFEKKEIKTSKGITLIALVVTIIVLLVLAGISINIAMGSNGLIQRARDSKIENEKGREKEIIAFAYDSALIKKTSNGDSTAVTVEDLNIELANQGATADGSSPIKVTFTASKRQYNINNGIVDYAGIKTDNPAGDGLEGLSSAEVALLPTGVTEKAIEKISNDNLKDATKIKAVITDSDNGEVPIPKGASYKEGSESSGVVIEYKGSQFVWVPIDGNLTVKGTNKLMAKESTGDYAGTTNGLTNYDGMLYDFVNINSTFDPRTGPSTTITVLDEPQPISRTQSENYSAWSIEPDLLESYDTDDLDKIKTEFYYKTGDASVENLTQTYIESIGYSTTTLWKNELQGSYNAMIDSVKKYGGFYVGRYESSISGTTVASISGVTPMSNINWYQMYKKQKDFSGNGTDTLQSNMIWGSQYDAMLNWMLTGSDAEKINLSSNDNTSTTNTGATETDILNNIYDLKGNYIEFTAEARNSGATATPTMRSVRRQKLCSCWIS
ncbi:MAG: hypothetical protein IKG56_03040 [Clostridia bacterium]|nr:hypothetical protein [Clostridia bacterium]